MNYGVAFLCGCIDSCVSYIIFKLFPVSLFLQIDGYYYYIMFYLIINLRKIFKKNNNN